MLLSAYGTVVCITQVENKDALSMIAHATRDTHYDHLLRATTSI